MMLIGKRSWVMGAACLLWTGVAFGQAPPGPLTPPPEPPHSSSDPIPAVPKPPEVKPRKNIMGAWKLNRDESDDGHRKLEQTRESGGRSSGNPRVGIGWPGMGGGGRRTPQDETADEDAGMQELLSPPSRVTLSEKMERDKEVDLADDHGRKRAFFTDGRKLQKSKDDRYEEIAARWDGERLITDEKSPRGKKISRSFELSPDGLQLWEEVRLIVGRNNRPVTIRYVYDPTSQE